MLIDDIYENRADEVVRRDYFGIWTRAWIDNAVRDLLPSAFERGMRQRPILGGETAMFRREDFHFINFKDLPQGLEKIRFWDVAATAAEEGTDPDWTVGTLMGLLDERVYILDVERFRDDPAEVENRIKQVAQMDGQFLKIVMEQEPGSSGKIVINAFAKKLLGYSFEGIPSTGNKVIRAEPFAKAVGNGLVYLVRADWNNEFINECEVFPFGLHDDQVDSSAGAFNQLFVEPEDVPNVRSF